MLPVLSLSRRLVSSALIAALVLSFVPVSAAPPSAGQANNGTIAGTARTASGEPLDNVTVQVRDLQSGRLIGTRTTGSDGRFNFEALSPGTYAVELVNAAGEVVGTSTAVFLSAPSMVATGLTVTASPAMRSAAGAPFFRSTWGIVTIAALGAGVVGITVAANSPNASPSR